MAALALFLVLLLVSCSQGNPFLPDGAGYAERKSGRVYRPLPANLEAAGRLAEYGRYDNEDRGFTLVFYEVDGLDTAVWLCDERFRLYTSGEISFDPLTATLTELLICDQTAGSVTKGVFSAEEHGATLAEILRLVASGTPCEAPSGAITYERRLKFSFVELPSVYYCVDFYMWGDVACFYDRAVGRFVPVPEALVSFVQGK